MASFEKQKSKDGSLEISKYPIRRFEISIKKFVKVLTIDLDRLDKHRQNTERLFHQENWTLLNKEQVNASRTVQQIKANLREIEKARAQIIEEDLEQFDAGIEDVKLKAVQAVRDFLLLSQTGTSSPLGDLTITPDSPTVSKISDFTSVNHSADDASVTSPPCGIPRPPVSPSQSASYSLPSSSELSQLQLVTNINQVNPETIASWEHLQEDLVDLNTMIYQFSNLVQEQGEKVDKIEDNIEKAHSNVQQGTSNLALASKYKAAIYPVAGAVIGGIMGGPVGLAAGLKIGSLAAVGGGVAGFFGGRALKKHQQDISDMEMKNISKYRSNSVTDPLDYDK